MLYFILTTRFVRTQSLGGHQMTINKYFVTQCSLYLLIFFSPLLLQPFKPSNALSINFTTFSYLIGAGLLIYFSQSLAETPIVEKKTTTTGKQVIIWGIYGLFLVFITQIAAGSIERLIWDSGQSQNTQNIAQLIRSSPFFLIAVSIAGPIMEEFIFRRSIIAFLSQYMAPIIAAIISSLLFAVVHADGHLLVYFSIGMVFYFLYQKTGSIWTSIIAHCSMNFFVMLLQLAI